VNRSRRSFLKTLGLGSLAIACGRCVSPPGEPGDSRAGKPNVVIFFTDDQGTLDANCYGSKDL